LEVMAGLPSAIPMTLPERNPALNGT